MMEMETEYAIDVLNLNKSFGTTQAVVDVSLKVRKGEIYGFLGPNGSGKTTTIRMLCGLLTPDQGGGYCLGYDIVRESQQIKRLIGYMTQKFSYYTDLTVIENLNFIAGMYQLPDASARIEELLIEHGLISFKDQLTGSLSGGWQQRLALAAALLHKPKLLLLDEPTAGVDPKARRDFWDTLHHLAAQGITTLVSTHYMDEAERCHRLAYIAQGNLLIHGTIDEIIDQVGLATWQVIGDHLAPLSEELKNAPGVEQVVTFGNQLHVSGKDRVLLSQTMLKYVSDRYACREMATTIEDVFIYLFEEG